jgi:hypothetical protein
VRAVNSLLSTCHSSSSTLHQLVTGHDTPCCTVVHYHCCHCWCNTACLLLLLLLCMHFFVQGESQAHRPAPARVTHACNGAEPQDWL